MSASKLWAAVTLAAALGGGCPRPPGEPQGEAARPGELLKVTGEQGRYQFELELDPSRPATGALFEVTTTVLDARTGERVVARKVAVDATMPHHGHGMTTSPRHEPLPDGRFVSRGMKLHMPGRWVFEVKAEAPPGADRGTVVFEQPQGAVQ